MEEFALLDGRSHMLQSGEELAPDPGSVVSKEVYQRLGHVRAALDFLEVLLETSSGHLSGLDAEAELGGAALPLPELHVAEFGDLPGLVFLFRRLGRVDGHHLLVKIGPSLVVRHLRLEECPAADLDVHDGDLARVRELLEEVLDLDKAWKWSVLVCHPLRITHIRRF